MINFLKSQPEALPASTTIACIVFCLALVFSLLGVVLGRACRWRWILQQGPGLSAVVGLAATILFLEIWNFFFRINHAAAAILGAFIFISAAMFWRTLVDVARNWFRNFSVLSAVFLVALLLTVSLFGSGPMERLHHDTGLYYLNSIRWSLDYPAVPGLANLHTRLGFNQSLFLLAAFLARLANLGLARACQLVNPVLFFISGWAVLDRLRLNLLTPKAKRVRLYVIFLLGPLLFLASHLYISTASADIAAAGLAFPVALAFLCCLEEVSERNPVEVKNWLQFLALAGCTVVKLKLSYAVLAGGAIGIAAVALATIYRPSFIWVWIRIGIVAGVVILPWAARGVVLSGYPFYPASFIRFRTDWAVSRDSADSDRSWIYSWAKWPDKDPDSVLKNNDWFRPWVERNAKDPENIFLFLFVAAGFGLALLSLIPPMTRKSRIITVILLSHSIIALIFWFDTAPDPRFGYATLLLFGVSGFYSFTSAVDRLSSIRSTVFACSITALSSGLILQNEWPLLNDFAMKFPQGFPKAELSYQTTDSGLRIGVPAGQKAWDSGLIVTPDFDPRLALRGHGLKDGFRIQAKQITRSTSAQ